jgi:hypothetical protein
MYIDLTPNPPIYALVFQVVSFPPPKNPVHTPFLPLRTTCPAHLILPHFITRIVLGEEYRSLTALYVYLYEFKTKN